MKQEGVITPGVTQELRTEGDGDIAAAAAPSATVPAVATSAATAAATASTASAAAAATATTAAAAATDAAAATAAAVAGTSSVIAAAPVSASPALDVALALDPSTRQPVLLEHQQHLQHQQHEEHQPHQELQHQLQHQEQPLEQQHQHQEQHAADAVQAPPATAHGDNHVSTGAVALATASAAKKNPTPFVCEVVGCNKAFGKKFNLKAHKRVHTGEEPFKCSFPTCEKMFKWKSSLTFHEGLHLNQPDDEPSLGLQALPVSVTPVQADQPPQPVQEHGPADAVEDIPADPTRNVASDVVVITHYPQDDAVNGEPAPKKQKV
jgi:hypothetical protein